MKPSRIKVGAEYESAMFLPPVRVLAIASGYVMLQRDGNWPSVDLLASFAERARPIAKRAKTGVKRAK